MIFVVDLMALENKQISLIGCMQLPEQSNLNKDIVVRTIVIV